MTIGAFCVIRNDHGEILLCHRRDKDMWNLPGGRVEEGEAPWQAAVREAKEEVGLDVTIKDFVACHMKSHENDLVFTFTATYDTTQSPGLSDEADAVAFYALDALPENTAPKQRERLEQCFRSGVTWPVLAEQ